MTRDELILRHAAIEKVYREKKHRVLVSGGLSQPEFRRVQAELKNLLEEKRAIELKMGMMKRAEAKQNESKNDAGRRFAFLCKAITEEFGGESLRSLLAEADRLSEIDKIAAEAEGYA